MKKSISLALCVAVILTIVTACSEKNSEPEYSYFTETIVQTTSADDSVNSTESESSEISSKPQTSSSKVSKPSSTGSKNNPTTSKNNSSSDKENKKPHFTQNLRAGVNFALMISNITADPNASIFQEKYYKIIKEAGFDHVRLPLGLSSLIVGKAPNYTLDEERLKFVDKAINFGLKSGLTMIIDNHEKSQYQNEELFVAVWKQMAERYKNYPKELFFDLVNEPNGGSDEQCNRVQLAAYKEIRKTNPTRVIVLAPNQWNGVWKLWDCEVPKIKDKKGNMVFDENIIVSAHIYSPMHFTHQGVGGNAANVHWSDDFVDSFTSDLANCADYEKRTGRTVWISEWGPTIDGHDPSCVESCYGKYYKTFTSACAKFDIAYAVWNFSDVPGNWNIYNSPKNDFSFQYKYLVLDW